MFFDERLLVKKEKKKKSVGRRTEIGSQEIGGGQSRWIGVE